MWEGHPTRLHDLRWFGGWQYLIPGCDTFHAARFTVPKLAVRIAQNTVDVFHWGRVENVKIQGIIKAIQEARRSTRPPRTAPNFVKSSRLVPELPEYLSRGGVVLSTIATGDCGKIVLSRKRIMRFAMPLDPLKVYSQIIANTGHVFQYLFCWPDLGSWVGISPELLLEQKSDMIAAKPLAGSRKRGNSELHDEVERRQLVSSDKENREHDLAAGLMHRQLRAICEPASLIITNAKQVMRLSYIQHLATEIKGSLQKPFDAFDALSCIYPPATILGTPDRRAAQVVSGCESFERGFFTGGLGMQSWHGDCEFALCVRTSLIKGSELHIFAGSGYVRGAIPEDEWTETETKMGPFVEVAESCPN
jgi:anthranilate synthase component 1